ncbi:MAG: tetratricopeptide repeat protein, partial [Acidobacteria bacterium]|nr:tetratricopeptide repeat protein [Acidobacteriota bacterium]
MKYNPSILSHQVLEDLFVGSDRERILQDIVDRASGAASSDERNHTLLVGRRGSGKSHLIALAYYRIGDLVTDESRSLQRSWLPEDPLTIHSYTEFLRQIAQGLLRSSGSEEQSFRGKNYETTEAWLTRRAVDAGTIVVFVENIDQILDTMGDLGQQRFRHYLQTTESLLIVASTTTLSRDLTRQDSPFFGFFTTSNLAPFDEHTASEMLTAIAEASGQTATADFVRTETGIARLRAIEHLAGGQPRMWATFGQTLTPADLDELVNTLLTQFDELTPYYQEQLARLSPLQRRIVGTLAQADRPLTIDSLARELEDTSQTVSKAVNLLHKSKGWVQPCDTNLTQLIDGRRTYYELAEPLARIIFQFKESRGEPIKLVVDFIKLWFDPDEIGVFPGSRNETISGYLLLAGQGDAATTLVRQFRGLPFSADVPRLSQLEELDEALAALSQGNPEPLLNLPSAVRRAAEDHLGDDPTDEQAIGKTRVFVHRAALGAFGDSRTPFRDSADDTVDRWMEAALNIVGSTPAGFALTALWACATGDFKAAESAILDCGRVLGRRHPDTLDARSSIASLLGRSGQVDEAIKQFTTLLEDRQRVLGPDHPDTLTTRSNIASWLGESGQVDEAIKQFTTLLKDRQRVLGPDHPDTLTTRNNIASLLGRSGQVDEA